MNQQSVTPEGLLQQIKPLLTPDQLKGYRNIVNQVIIDPELVKFIANLVHATRKNNSLYLGASPRASLALLKSAKACAAIKGRDFVTPDDIIEMAPAVLRHRILLTPEKEMEGLNADVVIEQIIKSLPVPR